MAFRRGLTVLEIIVSMAIFSIVIVVVATFVQVGGDTSSLVHAQTRAQMDAERILRLVRDQIGRSGYPPSGGDLVYTPNALTDEWEIAYNLIGQGPLVNMAPIPPALPVETVPWDPRRWVIKWEHPTDAAVGAGAGVDNDNDYIIDDGRVAIYQRTGVVAPFTDELTAVLANDVRDFNVTQDPDPPLPNGPRPRLRLQVTVERVLLNAAKSVADAAAVRAGAGPRARHTADMWVIAPN